MKIKQFGRVGDAGATEHYDDALYYTKTYKERTHDVDYYVKLARRSNGPVLEYGIGNGRVALPIARAGVEITGIEALRDLFVEARLRNELQAGGFDTALVESLRAVEAAIGLPGTSLDARLTAFFDAFAALGDDPMSAVARDSVVRRAADLGQGFAGVVDRLETARREADLTIQGSVGEVNRLAAEIVDVEHPRWGNGAGHWSEADCNSAGLAPTGALC